MTPLPPRGAWQREPSTLVVDRVDSARVIEAPFSIVSSSVETAVPLEFAPHAHPLHELVWVRGGTMTVRVDDRVLTVPEGRALWIPAGVRHSGRTTAGAVLHDALFDPGRAEVSLDAVTPVEVSGPLAALLDYLATATLSSEARVRAEAVVFDVLVPAPETLELRVPSDARIAAVASALVADPADARTASAWAESVGLSERTLTRLFRAHTGLSFARWRLVLRVHEAIALLSEGHEVQDVAPAVGYSQPSAFIEAFSRVLGVTPGAFATPPRAV